MYFVEDPVYIPKLAVYFVLSVIAVFILFYIFPKLQEIVYSAFLYGFIIAMIALVLGALTGWWDLGPWIDKFL